jgi:hypothetical protein
MNRAANPAIQKVAIRIRPATTRLTASRPAQSRKCPSMLWSAFTLASDGRAASGGIMRGLLLMKVSIGAPAWFGQR